MSSQGMAPPRRATNSANQPEAVSRRQLLASGVAAAAIVTLPTFAGTQRAADDGDVGVAHHADPTDEQRRLLAVLERHGPELGSGR